MERNRRRQNTKEKRTAIWKRCIAAAVAMVTVLTGFNYDGLANVFAKETSGYQIDVSYSEDKTSAVLTGNVGNVPAGTTLTAMTGADGTEYDPNSFQMTVTENGTYTYTLEYNVSVAETGQTVEQKENTGSNSGSDHGKTDCLEDNSVNREISIRITERFSGRCV